MEGASRVVIMPVDDSEHSARAFDWYVKYGHKEGDTLIVAHFHIPPPLPAMSLYHAAVKLTDEYKAVVEASVERARALMERYKNLCKEHGIHRESVLHTADDGIGESIVALAKEKGASFVVIGSRGLSKVRRTILGSVSEYVVNHCHVPITVVPPAHPVNPF